MAQIGVLKSRCGERMISGGVTVNVHTGKVIHDAPIKDWQMAESFTNQDYEWEEIGITEEEWDWVFGRS